MYRKLGEPQGKPGMVRRCTNEDYSAVKLTTKPFTYNLGLLNSAMGLDTSQALTWMPASHFKRRGSIPEQSMMDLWRGKRHNDRFIFVGTSVFPYQLSFQHCFMFIRLLYNGYRVFPGGKSARAWC
jgi:hypothetical protein